MEHFKLISRNVQAGYPEVEFTEIDKDRWEARKVGIFSGPKYGYVHIDQDQVIEIGGVGLSDKPWHFELEHEIWLKRNPQFEESKISKDEFETVWKVALEFWKKAHN